MVEVFILGRMELQHNSTRLYWDITLSSGPSNYFYLHTRYNKHRNTTLTDRDTILQLLLHKLSKAQTKMRSQADKHHVDVSFDIDDWVYLKLHPYRQVSKKKILPQKLYKRYYGPFQI